MGVLRIMYMIPQLLRINKKDRAYVQKLQNRRFRKLLKFTVANSAFYRDLYKGIDLDTCKVSDLPVVTKPMMMENFDDFVTDPQLKRTELRAWLSDKDNLGKMYKDKFIPYQTSGTTGENALIVCNRRSMDVVHATVMARHAMPDEPSFFRSLWRMMRTFFIERLKIATILMTGGPYPAFTVALFKPKSHDRFVHHEQLSLLDPIDTLVERLNKQQPDQLVSYPSTLDILAREQIAGRLKLSFTSDLSSIATSSEPLSETTKKLAKNAWGMEIQDTYGSSECYVLARSCGKFDRMHVMEDLCILEVVDRNNNPVPDGQPGNKILVTNLFNTVQPFIRYEISDVTGYSIQPCACSLPFKTLLPVEGRTDDIFYINRPGGGYEAVHPYLFLGPIVELDQVREYQLAQTGRNEVTFKYTPADPNADIDQTVREVLTAGLKMANLQDRIDLKLKKVETIPRDKKSGKFRQIVSLVGAPEDLDEAERVNH